MQVVDALVNTLVQIVDSSVDVVDTSAQKVALAQDKSSDHKDGGDDELRVARQSLRRNGLSRRCASIATGSLAIHAHGHIVTVPSLWRTWAGTRWPTVIQLPASLRRDSTEAELQSARLGSSGPHAVELPSRTDFNPPATWRSELRQFCNKKARCSTWKARPAPRPRYGPHRSRPRRRDQVH